MANQWMYEGKTANGQMKKGRVEAETEEGAHAKLRQMQITPSSLKKAGLLQSDLTIPGMGGVAKKDLVIFTRQFATMIDSGLPLVQCLDIQAEQAANPQFRKELTVIKETVEGGATFADALRKFPKTFDELYINLVSAGEIGGILDTILNRLAAYIEKNQKLKGQVKGAMTYPAVVLVVTIGCVTLLLVKVVPTFNQVFTEMGVELPLPTQILVDASEWLQSYFYVLIIAIIGIIVGYKMSMKSPKVRHVRDQIMLKAPVLGDLVVKSSVARFCRTLGTMISSGVPILDALEICSKTAGNSVIERAVMQTRDSISEGRTIAEPLAESKVFPQMVCQMISVGEATGALDTMLSKIADFYEDETEAAVGALTSALEPIMLVGLGGTVGFFVVAMYLPIFKAAAVIGG
jgi:type IV pilus assembly protein PilC